VGRRWVVAGFVLVVLADLLNVIQLARAGLFDGSVSRDQVEVILSLTATAMSLVAWSWLSALDAAGAQRRVVVRGFLAIAIQQVLFAVLSLLSLTTPHYSVDPLVRWSWALQCVGALVVALGLVMLAYGWPQRAALVPEEWPEEEDDPEVEAESASD
jgi:hypothetical protein